MVLQYEQASNSSPAGYRIIAGVYATVLAVVFVVPTSLTRDVAAVLCLIATGVSIYHKLKLRPSSVFLLAMASVILNTYAIGYAVTFKYAVVLSPLLSMIQAFLSLPFRVYEVPENKVKSS